MHAKVVDDSARVTPHSQLSQLFSENATLNKRSDTRKEKKASGANEIENYREASEKKSVKVHIFGDIFWDAMQP